MKHISFRKALFGSKKKKIKLGTILTQIDFINMLTGILDLDENQKISSNTQLFEILDSLGILSLMAMIDDQFNVVLSREDLRQYQTVDELYNFVMEKQNNG